MSDVQWVLRNVPSNIFTGLNRRKMQLIMVPIKFFLAPKTRPSANYDVVGTQVQNTRFRVHRCRVQSQIMPKTAVYHERTQTSLEESENCQRTNSQSDVTEQRFAVRISRE